MPRDSCISAVHAVVRSLSATFVYCVETAKDTAIVEMEGVCTISATSISATNHIGHDYIDHTKRPYRPKDITVSATKVYCYKCVNVDRLRLETSYAIPTHKRKAKQEVKVI